MATRRNKYPKPAPRAKRISGICAQARALGCNRDHLRLVIQGKRQSKSLLSEYLQLTTASRTAKKSQPKASR